MSTTTSEKLALAIANIDTIETVKNSLKTKFNIADDVPFSQYPDKISPVAEGETVFYKVASSYHDPYVPAHSNLQISGMETPSDGNGTFVDIRPDYLGFMRIWKNGNYACAYDSTNGYWCIYNASNTTVNYYNSYFYAKCMATTEQGNFANPWIWDNLAGGAGRSITGDIDVTKFYGYDRSVAYVSLKAGVKYSFGIVKNYDDSNGYIDLRSCLYRVSNDEQVSYSSSTTETVINGNSCIYTFEYTPSVNEMFLFGVYMYDRWDVTGNAKFVCYPAPEAWVEPSADPWDYSFVAQQGAGTLVASEVPVAEHLATKTWTGHRVYKKTNDNGSTYYDYADTITEGLTWSRFAPNRGEVWNADATLRADYLDEGNYYPDNATVWKIDITTDGKAYYMIVKGGEGNIIDWGDGVQTTIQDQSINTRYTHTYATAGTYYIQVIGDTVEEIHSETNSSYSTGGTAVKEAIQCSKNLLSCYWLFGDCDGLLKIADTFQLPCGVTSAGYMFYNCNALLEAPESLRIPASCTDFYDFMYECTKLKVDISHWFDNLIIGENSGRDIRNMFYRCYKITGTLPANKLWEDGSWFYSGGPMGSLSEYPFDGCTSLSNYNEIPTKWKG